MNKKIFLAEFIGTFALVFIGVGAIACNYISNGQSGLIGIALAHGLTIAVMVGALASISGAHFNPAVTVSLLCTHKIDLLSALNYISAQCLGAISAATLLRLCIPIAALNAVNMGTPALGPSVTIGMGILLEIILTFFLVFVIFGTIVNPNGPGPKVGGLFIGLTIVANIFIGGPLTGAAMNPARHLGPALLGGGFENIWIYWLAPIVGGILAGVCYDKFLLREN